MRTYVFVVSRRSPELLAAFASEFAGNSEIEIVQDRRIAQRRAVATPAWPAERERRQAERRLNTIGHHRLAQAGYFVVSVNRARFVRAIDERVQDPAVCGACELKIRSNEVPMRDAQTGRWFHRACWERNALRQ